MRTVASVLAMAAVLGLAAPASAHEAGDWLVRVGGSLVDPKSDNGTLAVLDEQINVDDKWGVTFNFTYMYSANLGIEVLAALPYKHDIDVANVGRVGSVKHLPPTVSLQYHFMPQAAFQPYAGVGLNYTLFFDEDETSLLEDDGLSLDVDSSSFGLAAQVGFDYILTDRMFLNFDVRWIDIDVDAEIKEVPDIRGEVNIDPMVYGVHLGYRF